MNYYELIYLKQHLNYKLRNQFFDRAITPYKNLLELFFDGDDDPARLVFSSSPANTALFTDTFRPGKKNNTITFFEGLEGVRVKEVDIPKTDRWVYIHFENDQTLQFRLFSYQANVFLKETNTIREVFKEYDEIGDKAPDPQELELFDAPPGNKSTKNTILALNPMFPRQNMQELIEYNELDKLDHAELSAFVRKCVDEMRNDPSFRLLVTGETTLLSEETLQVETEKIFSNVNDLISWRYKNYSNAQRLKQKKAGFEKALKRKIKRLRSSLSNLENADKGLEKAERFEQWGHSLMANAHLSHEGKDHIEVKDLYGDNNSIKIPLKRELDIAANAQRYYQKARNSKSSYQEAVERTPVLEEEKKHFEELLSQISAQKNIWELQDWEKEHSNDLSSVMNQSQNTEKEESSAFHQLRIKDYECWIGKNARSNDKLLQAGHKEDVWLHARGVPGSHMLIRMENDKGMPEKAVLLEAASYAAYHSKAKGSKLAPVIITKKKYVRKPKGSAPGAVLIDKEEVEMVSPRKPSHD